MLLIERLSQFPTLSGNALELLADYDGVVDRLVADIDGATDHVHLLTYIFSTDATARRVIDALDRAASRGVSCRVLIDSVGSHAWARRVHRLLSDADVEIANALPISLLRRRSARADLRNHRKIIIVDARVGYIGSQNIVGAEASPGVFNKELVVRVDGPVVLELQAVFAADWFLDTGRMLDAPKFFEHEHTAGGAVAQVLASGPDHPVAGAGRLVVALAHGARHRIVITTPYFIPDEPLLQALQTAVLRGVDVRLMLSRVSDNWLVSLAQRSYYEELLSAGVAIHLYREGLLHAKHISVDGDISLIGSSNIDVRSFRLNAEAGLVVYDRDVTARLGSEQDRDLAASDRLVQAQWARRPFRAKLGENVARLMSPLL